MSARPMTDGPEHVTDQLSPDQLTRLATVGLHAAELAHEFTSPLTIVLTQLELVQRQLIRTRPDPPPADAVRVAVDSALTYARRMKWLIGQLRRVVTEGHGVGALVETRVADLNRVVQEAVRAAKSVYATSPIREVYASLPPVPLDPGWLWQALVNILKNAAEAMDGTGTVFVHTARRTQESVEVSIRDTGPGIAPERLRTLFCPLITTKGSMGLGLAICHDIVAAHRGRIDVDSELGHGTTVRVRLPIEVNGSVP